MSKRIELHPEALAEAAGARDWYTQRSPRAAVRFLDALDRAVEAIGEAPQRWAKFLYGTRRHRLSRFPYLLVYMEGDDSILVIAVAHAKRRPGYWRGRV